MKTAARAKSKPAKKPWSTLRDKDVQILQAAPLRALPWLVHGFTTRSSGESKLDGGRVLNLGTVEWDTRAAIQANRRRVLMALDAEEMTLVTLRQIHSDLARSYTEAPPHGLRGDAHLTRTPGLLLAVQTADCIPILLADTKRRAVAAVHAGWRGTLKRIAAKALGRMQMHYGTRPADVVAVLGPGVGSCCYEVGPEVVKSFAGQFAEAAEWFAPTDTGPHGQRATFEGMQSSDGPNPLKWLWMTPPGHDPPPPALKLDLFAANRWQLADAGVPPRNIISSELCTACRTDLLFSYRKERGRTGRLMGLIGIRP